MSHFFKLETLVVGLFSISLLLVAAYELCPKILTIDGTGDQWFTCIEVDSVKGGNSIGIDESNDSELRYTYKLGDSDLYPYSVLIVSPQHDFKMQQVAQHVEETEEESVDWRNVFIEKEELPSLDWMEKMRIVARIEGKPQETFRIHFRSRIDKVYDTSDPIPRIFTEGYFNLTDENQEIVVRREQFHVPYWWLEQFKVDLYKHNRPKFSALEWLEFLPSSHASNKEATLVIDSIQFEGHHFPRQAFYGFILGLWMTMAVGVIIERTLKMAREMRSLEARAERANIDFLTGLLNRHVVKDPTASFQSFREDSTKSLSLVMFDIDHFKLLNDTYGHNYGDAVLKDVADVVARLTEDDALTAIRWGGEEFLVIAEGIDELTAAGFAEKLRRQIEEATCVRCSFGVYEVDCEESLTEGIGKADKALYASKWRGRNCVTRFSDCPDQLNREIDQVPVEEKPRVAVSQSVRVAGLVAAAESVGSSANSSSMNIKI